MKKIFHISIIIFLASCNSKPKPEFKIQEQVKKDTVITEKQIPLWKINPDTILEKNDPKNLDLTKHQLFIDTTRNSQFYKDYLNWKPNKQQKNDTDYYLNKISKKHKLQDVSIGKFPTTWIVLDKLNNEFVVYNQCDGISPRFMIDKNSINFYSLESVSDMIHSLIKKTDSEIVIELRTITQKSKTEKGVLSIKKTEYENVYFLKLEYDDWNLKQLVTSIENVTRFDMIVNNCVKTKRMEYSEFDKINYDKY